MRAATVDFFEARGLFRARRDYHGMAGSLADELFTEFFSGASETEKPELARTLISIAIVEEAAHPEDYVTEAVLLIGSVSRDVGGQWFHSHVGTIREVLEDPTRFNSWRQPETYNPPKPFREDHRFATSLLFSLYFIDSETAEKVWKLLMSKAAGSDFARYLEDVKSAYLALTESGPASGADA